MTEGHVLPNDLALVDPQLARQFEGLMGLANRRQLLQTLLAGSNDDAPAVVGDRDNHLKSPEATKAALQLLDGEVEDLCLNFVLPGYEVCFGDTLFYYYYTSYLLCVNCTGLSFWVY